MWDGLNSCQAPSVTLWPGCRSIMSDWACVSSPGPRNRRFPRQPPSEDKGWLGTKGRQLFCVLGFLLQVARFEKLLKVGTPRGGRGGLGPCSRRKVALGILFPNGVGAGKPCPRFLGVSLESWANPHPALLSSGWGARRQRVLFCAADKPSPKGPRCRCWAVRPGHPQPRGGGRWMELSWSRTQQATRSEAQGKGGALSGQFCG